MHNQWRLVLRSTRARALPKILNKRKLFIKNLNKMKYIILRQSYSQLPEKGEVPSDESCSTITNILRVYYHFIYYRHCNVLYCGITRRRAQLRCARINRIKFNNLSPLIGTNYTAMPGTNEMCPS